MDDPHHINWWEGILMVNNEKAQFAKDDHGHLHRTDGFLTRLLYRYENDKDPCDDKNQPPPFLASLINFGLLVFLLYRFGKKPIAEALANRRKEVMGDIDKATQLKREAQERLDEYEEKLRKLDETLEEMRVDHKQQSEAERRQVLAEAEERRVRMKKDVEIRLVQEAKATREELLREAVDAAVIAAEEILRKKVGQADHDRAQDAYLEAVGTIVKSDRSAPSTSAQASGGAS